MFDITKDPDQRKGWKAESYELLLSPYGGWDAYIDIFEDFPNAKNFDALINNEGILHFEPIILNSMEELLEVDLHTMNLGWRLFYINFPLSVYRGSSVIGRYKENWTWKRWLDGDKMGTSRNMGVDDSQPTTLNIQEALSYAQGERRFADFDKMDFELYAIDIQDYFVKMPRPSARYVHRNCNPVLPKGYYINNIWQDDGVVSCDNPNHKEVKGSQTPVIFILGGAKNDDMQVLWDGDVSAQYESFNSEIISEIAADSEDEESMRVYRRMSWEQYFDALETGYLMSTVERYQKDGFVPKGAWGMMNDVYASKVPEFESPLEHLGRDVNPTFEIELLPTDDFRESFGVVTIRSPIPIERVIPFNMNETVKRFDSEDVPAENYVSQDYPKCYLCNLPAKIEVGTALGMRSFCGNKCRGDYEGIDYGPDDYFISPKLEHEIYVFDYSPEEYNLKARSIIKCRNCDFVAEYTFDSNHMKLRGDWHLHKDENGDVLHPDEIGYCEHEMNVIKYISSGWDNQGSAIIRCKLCRFADEIRAEIPEGCNNRGQNNPKWFGSEQSNSDMHNKRVTLHRHANYAGLNQKYPEVNYPMAINLSRQNYFAVPRKAFDGLAALFSADWEDIDWSPKINHIGDTVKWDSPHPTHKYISTSGIFYSPEGHIGLQLRSFNVMAPNTWSGISGFLDKGETPYEGVIREINEETGLSLDIIKNWKFSIIWDDGAHLTYIFHVDKEFYPEVNEYKWEWTDFKWAEPNSWKQVSNLHPGIVPLANVDFNQFN